MAAVPAARSDASAATFFCRGVIFYSTTVPNDPDTHEDFRPTIKLESSGLSLTDIVEQDVKEKPVMIYMKGVPDLPRCGFSSLAVRVLKEYSIPISARNILENVELKNAVKAYRILLSLGTHLWEPDVLDTLLYIKQLAYIPTNIHQSTQENKCFTRNGELKEKLKDIMGGSEKAE